MGATATVIVQFCNLKFLHSVTSSSTIDELKVIAISRWIALRNIDFYFSYICEGNKMYVKFDFQLQSMICYYIMHNVDSFDLFVEFDGDCSSSGVVSIDDYSVVEDELAEDSTTAFIEDGAIVSRPRRLKEWENVLGDVGQQFLGGVDAVRAAVTKHCIAFGFQYTIVKSCPDRYTVKCALFASPCEWRLHASPVNGQLNLFEIKTFHKEHTCGVGSTDSRKFKCNRKFVQNIIMDDIRHNPNKKKAVDIREIFERDYGIELTYHQAYSGLEYGKQVLWGDDIKAYSSFRWYVDAVKKYNNGSAVVLEVNEQSNKFERFFVAFEACIYGFNNWCRPMIFLDATFLVGKYKGALMVAVGKNGNQEIYPLAFGIVSTENAENWVWFLTNLKDILGHRMVTFISDRGTGLLHAVPRVFPGYPHSYCYFHMKQNIPVSKNDKRHKAAVNLFKYAYYALTPQGFANALKSIRIYNLKKMLIWINSIPHEKWATYAFKGMRYGEKCSNVAESFNNWVKNDKDLPHCYLADQIRLRIMKMMFQRKKIAETWKSYLTPEMEKRLKRIKDVGTRYKVIQGGDGLFEVYTLVPPKKHLVQLCALHCSCRRWVVNGFPCSHAVQCILRYTNQSVYNYVDPAYTTACYNNAYSHPIFPIPDFEKTDVVDEINPPNVVKSSGRPSKKRLISQSEKPRKKRICGNCGIPSLHNRRTCPDPAAASPIKTGQGRKTHGLGSYFGL